MRWMVVALLLANLLAYGWYRYAVGLGVDEAIPLIEGEPAGSALRLLDSAMDDSDSTELGVGRAGAIAAEQSSVPTSSAVSMCGMIGAFAEQISAKQVRDRLRALGATADIAEVPVTLRTDYWVHMGPYPSREQAMTALRDLQQKGVDSFLIADGELANGVSLGLFRQRASAEALLAERKAQGYAVALREIPRVSNELWVVINEGSELAEPVRRQLLAVSPGTEYRKNSCSSIVTVSKFE